MEEHREEATFFHADSARASHSYVKKLQLTRLLQSAAGMLNEFPRDVLSGFIENSKVIVDCDGVFTWFFTMRKEGATRETPLQNEEFKRVKEYY